MNNKGVVFAIGVMLITLGLIVASLFFITDGSISKRNDKVGEIALEVLNKEIEFQVALLSQTGNIDSRVKNFFLEGASNEISLKKTDEGELKLWSKNCAGVIKKKYPDKVEDSLKEYLGAESVEVEEGRTNFNFGKYNSVIENNGGIRNFKLEYSNDLVISRDYKKEIDEANEFFTEMKKCGLNEECYVKLGGEKTELGNAYLFDIELSSSIRLKGAVSLEPGNSLTEEFEC